MPGWDKEKLAGAGFAVTASVIGALEVPSEEKAKLCEAILLEHFNGRTSSCSPGGAAAKVKSEAPTPSAEQRDSSPLIAKMLGVSFLSPRGKFDVEFRQSSLSFIDKNGALAAACPVANFAMVFDQAVPAGAQKVKTFCVAVGLKDAITFGKSQLKVLAMQAKETESSKVDIKGEAASGNSPEGLQETGMGFGVLSGPTHEVVASLLACVAGKAIEKHKPETFMSVAREGAVKCNIKSVHDGFLFFHTIGLLFINKFLFIPRNEVKSIDFTGATGRTFDLQVQTRGGDKHEFSMIAKEEHQRVAEYIQLMQFKNAQQAAASADNAPTDAVGRSEEGGGGGSSTAAVSGASAGKETAGQETKDDGDDSDDDDDDDEDFDAGSESDESEGYDAIEAADPDALGADDAEDSSEDEEESEEEHGDEEDDDGDGKDIDESGSHDKTADDEAARAAAKRELEGGDTDDEGPAGGPAGSAGGASKKLKTAE